MKKKIPHVFKKLKEQVYIYYIIFLLRTVLLSLIYHLLLEYQLWYQMWFLNPTIY